MAHVSQRSRRVPLLLLSMPGSRNVQARHELCQCRFTSVAVRCDTSEETRVQQVRAFRGRYLLSRLAIEPVIVL